MNYIGKYRLVVICIFICQLSVFAQKKPKSAKEKEFIHQGKDDHKQIQAGVTLPYKMLFYEAMRLKTVGAIDSAVPLFEECVIQNPKEDAAYYVLAEYYSEKHQLAKALKNIQQAYDIDPNNIWYLEMLAFVQQSGGNYEAAEKYFAKLIQSESHNIDWLYGYSQAQLYNGKIKEAIGTYNKMIDEVGPVPELVSRKMDLMIDQKQDELMIKEITALIEEFPEAPEYASMLVDYYQRKGDKVAAKDLLEKLIVKNPTNGSYQLGLSDYYNNVGDEKNTYKYLKQAFANDQIDLDTKVKLLIDMHDNQNVIDSNVFTLARILEEKYPESAKTYAIQGDLFLKNKEDVLALQAFKKALKYDQSKFSVWNEVLILQYQTQQYDSLFAYGQKALELFPSFANLYLLTGIGAIQTQHYDDAESIFSQGKNYALKDRRMTAEFQFQLAETYVKQKKLKQAWEYFDKAIALDSSNAMYLNNYAYRLSVNKTELDKALALIQKAIEIKPSDANFMDTYAWVLFEMKNYTEAKVWIEKALQASPGNKDFLNHYGDILFFLGDKQKAVESWKKAKLAGKNDSNLDKKINNEQYYETTPD
ncbi:MAG: tetratricopeptide repeat protein [Crocinitomicaceae bacterium]